jgi:hypothetical protein
MIEKSHIGFSELPTQKLKGSPIGTLAKMEMASKLMRMSSGITPKFTNNVDIFTILHMCGQLSRCGQNQPNICFAQQYVKTPFMLI